MCNNCGSNRILTIEAGRPDIFCNGEWCCNQEIPEIGLNGDAFIIDVCLDCKTIQTEGKVETLQLTLAKDHTKTLTI
jgi:hypothetical protein